MGAEDTIGGGLLHDSVILVLSLESDSGRLLSKKPRAGKSSPPPLSALLLVIKGMDLGVDTFSRNITVF